MPRLLNIYIFKEISVPFVLSLTVLTATALLSKAIKLVELMVTSGVSISFVFWFVASVIPSFLIYTIPISFLAAVLIAFTRLSSDSEITAMKALGLSLFKIIKPVFFAAFAAFIMTLLVTMYLFPWGNQNLKQLLFDAGRSGFTAALEEKTFYDRFKGMVLYVDHYSHETGEMQGVFVSQETPGGQSTLFFANKGIFVPSEGGDSVFLRLSDGTVHKKNDRDGSYHLADYRTYTLELKFEGTAPAAATAQRHNRELYAGELAGRIRELKARGEDTAPYLIDLHKRFALPASIFVFAIIGVPLGIQKIRTARFTGFSITLAVVLAYYLTSTAFEALGENGVLNPLFSVWGSDILFGAAGLYIFYMAARDTPVNLMAVLKPFGVKARRARQR